MSTETAPTDLTLDERVAALEQQMSVVQSDVATLKTQVGILQSTSAILKSQIVTLQNNDTSQAAAIANLQTSDGSQGAAISKLQADLAALQQTVSYNDLRLKSLEAWNRSPGKSRAKLVPSGLAVNPYPNAP